MGNVFRLVFGYFEEQIDHLWNYLENLAKKVHLEQNKYRDKVWELSFIKVVL